MPFLSNTDSRALTSSSRQYSNSFSNSPVQSMKGYPTPSRQSPMVSGNGRNYGSSAYHQGYPYPQAFSYAINFPPLPGNQNLQRTNSAVSSLSSRSNRSSVSSVSSLSSQSNNYNRYRS